MEKTKREEECVAVDTIVRAAFIRERQCLFFGEFGMTRAADFK
jgi:hypothetical protein